jgi:hypothetical protein
MARPYRLAQTVTRRTQTDSMLESLPGFSVQKDKGVNEEG